MSSPARPPLPASPPSLPGKEAGGVASALALDGVTFAYAGAPVVRDVTLRLRPGEMVALLGPNGAGKSTLLKLASGILTPGHGSIRLAGTDLRRLARDAVARRVAVVPQDFAVQFAYT